MAGLIAGHSRQLQRNALDTSGPPRRCGASDKPAAHAMTKASRLCRSVGRSAEAAAARARLAQSQAPGTHRCLTTAVTPANPQAISSVSIGRQLAEHLTAPQSR